MSENIFVLGLDRHNRELLQGLPDVADCCFHPLLNIGELQYGEDIPLADLLLRARQQLASFDGPIGAIIGFWDFPISSMVPILNRQFGLTNCATLSAVLKCEHKYWSRLQQQKVIDEYPHFGLVDLELDEGPPAGVSYPMWLKPVKSFSSGLAFGVNSPEEFREATTAIRAGIGRIGEPFDVVLTHLDLPPEMSGVGGQACLAEETLSGKQVTLEGYCFRGEFCVYGIVDSVNCGDIPSFLRYQYPSNLPAEVADRMIDVAGRVVEQIGLDNSTFNIEFFWNPETDRIGLLEINPRHSQSHAELFQRVDGVSNHQAMVRIARGRDPRMPHREGRCPLAAKWFLRRRTDGVVRRCPTPREVALVERDNPGTTIEVIVREGDRLSELIDQDSYSYKIADIYTGAADEEELTAQFERCAEALHFEFDD